MTQDKCTESKRKQYQRTSDTFSFRLSERKSLICVTPSSLLSMPLRLHPIALIRRCRGHPWAPAKDSRSLKPFSSNQLPSPRLLLIRTENEKRPPLIECCGCTDHGVGQCDFNTGAIHHREQISVARLSQRNCGHTGASQFELLHPVSKTHERDLFY